MSSGGQFAATQVILQAEVEYHKHFPQSKGGAVKRLAYLNILCVVFLLLGMSIALERLLDLSV